MHAQRFSRFRNTANRLESGKARDPRAFLFAPYSVNDLFMQTAVNKRVNEVRSGILKSCS